MGNVLHVDLIKQTETGSQINYNRELLNLRYADVAEETILSKVNFYLQIYKRPPTCKKITNKSYPTLLPNFKRTFFS